MEFGGSVKFTSPKYRLNRRKGNLQSYDLEFGIRDGANRVCYNDKELRGKGDPWLRPL
jgi:hypothetical protein